MEYYERTRVPAYSMVGQVHEAIALESGAALTLVLRRVGVRGAANRLSIWLFREQKALR